MKIRDDAHRHSVCEVKIIGVDSLAYLERYQNGLEPGSD